MKTITHVDRGTKRTHTRPAAASPAGQKAACREALRWARRTESGWEHYAGLVVYVSDGDGGATRLAKSDEGRTLGERVIPAR